jgi:hypothetical protein
MSPKASAPPNAATARPIVWSPASACRWRHDSVADFPSLNIQRAFNKNISLGRLLG